MQRPLALASLALVSALSVALPDPAYAQAPQHRHAQAAPGGPGMPGPGPSVAPETEARSIEGRLAYWKAMLDLRADQQALWAPVEQAMRTNAQEAAAIRARVRQAASATDLGAIERLELRTELAKSRATASERFLVAFKPLYAALSEPQKKIAGDLVRQGGGARHGHGGHGGMRRS